MVSVRLHCLPASRKAAHASSLLEFRIHPTWPRCGCASSRPFGTSNPRADVEPRRGCAASGSSIAPVGIAGGMSRTPLRHRFRLTRGDRLWELSTVNNLSGRRERLQALLFHATKTA
jgi:hypothetical protein